MHRHLIVLLSFLFFLLTLAGCGGTSNEESSDTAQKQSLALEKSNKAFAQDMQDTARRIKSLETQEEKINQEINNLKLKQGEAESLISREKNGLALMSQGRLVVSYPDDRRVLMEADPSKDSVSIFSTLNVSSDITTQGSLRAQSLQVLQNISAPSFSANNFSVNEAGELSAAHLSAPVATLNTVEVGELSAAQSISAKQAHIGTLSVDKLVVKNQDKQGARSEVKSNVIEELKTQLNSKTEELDKKVQKLAEYIASRDSDTQNYFEELSAKRGIVQDLSAQFISHVKELTAENVQAKTLDVNRVSAKELSGSLDGLYLSPENYGEVRFKAPKDNEVSHLQRIQLPVPKNTYALFFEQPYSAHQQGAKISSLKYEGNYYLICEYDPNHKNPQDISLVWYVLSR